MLTPRHVVRHVLMKWLTPLGWIVYGTRLRWNAIKLEACQRCNATDMHDLNDLVLEVNRLRAILAGSTV